MKVAGVLNATGEKNWNKADTQKGGEKAKRNVKRNILKGKKKRREREIWLENRSEQIPKGREEQKKKEKIGQMENLSVG